MKVTIVTFHRAFNYGAVLQCAALCRVVDKLGLECEVLDYWPQCFEQFYCCKTPFRISSQYLKLLLKHILLSKTLRKRNRNFEQFIKQNLPLTKSTMRSEDDLQKYRSDTDCYIAGSDMIWDYRCCNFDKSFFLDFSDATDKFKISYAASFGDDLLLCQ